MNPAPTYGCSNPNALNQAPQPEPGLSTAIKELFEVSSQTYSVAQGIEHSLGLSTPATAAQGETPKPEGQPPRSTLSSAACGWRTTNSKRRAATSTHNPLIIR